MHRKARSLFLSSIPRVELYILHETFPQNYVSDRRRSCGRSISLSNVEYRMKYRISYCIKRRVTHDVEIWIFEYLFKIEQCIAILNTVSTCRRLFQHIASKYQLLHRNMRYRVDNHPNVVITDKNNSWRMHITARNVRTISRPKILRHISSRWQMSILVKCRAFHLLAMGTFMGVKTLPVLKAPPKKLTCIARPRFGVYA